MTETRPDSDATYAKQTTISAAFGGALLVALGTLMAALALPDLGDGLTTASDPGSPVVHLVGLMVAALGGLLLTVATVAAGVSLGMRMSADTQKPPAQP